MSGLDRCQRWLSGSCKLRQAAAWTVVALASGVLLPAAAWSSQDANALAVPATPGLASEPVLEGLPRAATRLADLRDATASAEVRELADWVVHSRDHGHFPFIVIDKVQAQVFVFDNAGVLRGAAPALLGIAVGDDSVPGIGQRKLSSIKPHERTTPAGRFMGYLDRDIHGEEVLWIDYDTAFSLHRMPKGQPKERRAERMATPTPADNRISYGCVNVPVSFYETVVSPLLRKTQGVVYVLPETRPARVVFGSYPVDRAEAPRATASAAPTAEPAAPAVADPTRTVSSDGPSLSR